jgi:hypothetical protein
VYLNEDRLSQALFKFLADAVFGPVRHDYWQRCLDQAGGPERAAPASERIKELTAEVADLERRLARQLINLEADDLTPSLRRRINERVSELEDAITERNQRRSALAEQAATETPSLADVAPLLDRLLSWRRSWPIYRRRSSGLSSTGCSSRSSTTRPRALSTSR